MPVVAVDRHDGFVEVEHAAVVVVATLGHDVEARRVSAFEVRRERHPVVGLPRFGAEYGDAPLPIGVPRPHLLDETLADHPVADDDQMAFGRAHAGTSCGWTSCGSNRLRRKAFCGVRRRASAASSQVTIPRAASRQVPQPVVQRVRRATSSRVRAPSCQAAVMSPFVTPLHWQMVVRSGSVVGDCALAGSAASRLQQPGALGGQGGAALEELAERSGRAGVAEQDGAREPAVVDDELLVDATRMIGEADDLRAVGGGGVPRIRRGRSGSEGQPARCLRPSAGSADASRCSRPRRPAGRAARQRREPAPRRGPPDRRSARGVRRTRRSP